MTILEELNEIFREVFDDDGLNITESTNANDIEEWDSFSHMNLVMSIELKYGIKFALGELQALLNVGDMVKMIESKL